MAGSEEAVGGAARSHDFAAGHRAAAAARVLKDVGKDRQHLIDKDVSEAAFERCDLFDGLIEFVDELARVGVIGLLRDEHDSIQAIVRDDARRHRGDETRGNSRGGDRVAERGGCYWRDELSHACRERR